MKRFHVSMLLALLCSVPLCAMDNDNGAAGIDDNNDPEFITNEQFQTLVNTVKRLDAQVAVLSAPSMASRTCSGAIGYAMVPVDAVVRGYAGLSDARKAQINAAAYFVKEGSIDAVVYAAAQTELVNKGVQRIFNNEDKQAGLAVCSAVAQGLRKAKGVWNADIVEFSLKSKKKFRPGKIAKTAAVAFAVAQDVATNVVVAKAKGFVANKALNPLVQMAQEKYGINVRGSKLLNVAADVSSWIVLRRVVEKGAMCVGGMQTTPLFNKK